jgi:hypothetical protein
MKGTEIVSSNDDKYSIIEFVYFFSLMLNFSIAVLKVKNFFSVCIELRREIEKINAATIIVRAKMTANDFNPIRNLWRCNSKC